MFASTVRRALAPAAGICAAGLATRNFDPRQNGVTPTARCDDLKFWKAVPQFLTPLARQGRELTDLDEAKKLQEVADIIVKSGIDVEELKRVTYPNSRDYPSNFISAIALADSAKKMQASGKPFHLTIVHAMFGEKDRMASPKDNPDGQDFVRSKKQQIEWLLNNYAPQGTTWSYIACDDGCPVGSGKLMEAVIIEEKLKNVNVVYLQQGIDDKTPPFNQLKSTNESRKGGAILYGLHRAAQQKIDGGRKHIIAYFDADLSADLGLCGLLTHPIMKGGAKVSVGQRYGCPGSFLVLPHGADGHPASVWNNTDCHKMIFRHFARSILMPPLKPIKDTQCAFKALDAEKVPEVVARMSAFGPTFDMELLIASAAVWNKESAPLFPVPFPFIEDKEGSTMSSTDEKALQSFWKMLKEMVKIHDKYYKDQKYSAEEKAWIDVFRNISLEGYTAVINEMKAKFGPEPPAALETQLNIAEVKKWAKM